MNMNHGACSGSLEEDTSMKFRGSARGSLCRERCNALLANLITQLLLLDECRLLIPKCNAPEMLKKQIPVLPQPDSSGLINSSHGL